MDRGAISIIRTLAVLITRADLGVRGDLAKGVCLELLGLALATAGPFGLKFAIDNLSAKDASPGWIVLAVAVFVVSWALSTIVGIWRLAYSTQVINVAARAMTADALQGHLPAAVTSKDGDSGRALGAIERLPFSLQTVVDGILWRGGPLIVQLVITLGLIAMLVPLQYIAVLAFTSTGFILLSWLSARRYAFVAAKANQATASVSQILGDVLRNARRVVLNGAIPQELTEVGERYTARQRADLAVVWSLLQMTSVQFGLVTVGLVLLLIMGVYDVRAQRITVGDFVLLQTFAFRLIMPLSGFGYILSQSGVAFANIADVLDLATVQKPDPDIYQESPDPGRVVLDRVDFSYGHGQNGITGVSLDFAPGTFNLIVGANGSGKSTLAQVIAGVLPPKSGAVVVNGVPMREVPDSARYRHVLYVPQFIGLFNRSLLANALYPPTSHSAEQMADELYHLQFYDQGKTIDLDQVVGEQGERLSGGQVQKLELARLMGINVPVLILDESTSALDAISEAQAVTRLRRIHATTTLILISHRLGMAVHADNVVLMSRGRTAAIGSHLQLLDASDAYRELWGIATAVVP